MSQEKAKRRQDTIFKEELLPQIDALYNFAYHLTYNEEDANDLVQETFLKALRFIDSYGEGSNAKAWLFTILRNAFINDYRKKTKRPNKVDFEEITTYHHEEDSNFSGYFDLRTEIFDHLLGDEVTKALNDLPDEYKTVILLADIENFKYEEIAEILEVPTGTVRSRLFRARNMLKKQLKTYAEALGFKDHR